MKIDAIELHRIGMRWSPRSALGRLPLSPNNPHICGWLMACVVLFVVMT